MEQKAVIGAEAIEIALGDDQKKKKKEGGRGGGGMMLGIYNA
jgi:hypothetical protein